MKKSRAAVGVATAALLLSACSGDADSSGGSAADGDVDVVTDGTLTFGINEDPGNLYRHVNSSATLSYVYPWAYESLVYFTDDGEPQPWLAESWEESPTELTFTVREGVTCSDGTPMTAETVANNFRWILDPENGSSMLGLVVPADITVESDEEARTVTLNAEVANSFLLPQVGIHPMYCQAALDDPDSVASTTNGTGLFELTEAVPNDRYVFTRRDDYAWAPEGGNDGDTPGVPQTVVVRIVENPSTRANLLLSGDLTMTAIQGPDEDRVAAQSDQVIASRLNTGGFAYSQAEGMPTSEEQVRVALTHALDLDALMQVQTAGTGSRATALAVLPPVICQYDAATPNLPAHDPEEAGRLLDEAGWTLGSDGVRARDGEPLALTLLYNTRWPETASTVELMQEQWAAIGVQTTLEGSDYNTFASRAFTEGSAEQYDVFWLASNYYVPGPLSAFVAGPTPPDGNNMAAVSNPEYDDLVAQASDFTGQEACGVWEQAETEMYTSADFVPFATRPDVTYGQGVTSVLETGLMATAYLLTQD